MRKQKSVVAILLAVMMIFTFMPTMAFAYSTDGTASGTTIDWGDTFEKATYTTSTGTKELSIKYGIDTNGMITATAYEVVDGAEVTRGTANFYNLSGATLYRTANAVVSGEYAYSTYTGLFNTDLYVKLAKPSYITDAQWTTAALTNAKNSFTGGWTVRAVGTPVETAAKGDVLTINTKTATTQTATGSDTAPFVIGDDLSASVTIKDGSDVSSDAGFYYDKVAASTRFTSEDGTALSGAPKLTYDGKEHKVLYVAKTTYPTPLTITYQKYNSSRGVWEDLPDGIVVKDAGTYSGYRVHIVDASKGTHDKPNDTDTDYTKALSFTVEPETVDPTFGFKAAASTRTEKYNYEVTPEQAADPSKFVELTANSFVAGDEEALTNFFNEYYKIEVTKVASNENLQTWTISPKYDSSTTAGAKAIADITKKYGQLLANYDRATIAADGTVTMTGSYFGLNRARVTVKVDGSDEINTKDDDITFTGVTTKAFKAKKKTKKLAKTKSFQIAAAADSGNVVTFKATTSNAKIKVSATGKVTVKKGLKKGTYKVVVKAKTAAGNGYKACKESKTYTIKVK